MAREAEFPLPGADRHQAVPAVRPALLERVDDLILPREDGHDLAGPRPAEHLDLVAVAEQRRPTEHREAVGVEPAVLHELAGRDAPAAHPQGRDGLGSLAVAPEGCGEGEVLQGGVDDGGLVRLLHLAHALELGVHVVDGAAVREGVARPLRDQHRDHEGHHVGEAARQLEEDHGERDREARDAREHRAGADHGVDAWLHSAARCPEEAGVLQGGPHGAAEAAAYVQRGDEEACGGQGPDRHRHLNEAERRGPEQQALQGEEGGDVLHGAAEA
mmetsp:Transcript_42828/g.126891  ORF Transcript_42828/g.126891 Transcript_42828/m.126891 type:complete len:273 (-) Transcript_42828:1857-2675(-)